MSREERAVVPVSDESGYEIRKRSPEEESGDDPPETKSGRQVERT